MVLSVARRPKKHEEEFHHVAQNLLSVARPRRCEGNEAVNAGPLWRCPCMLLCGSWQGGLAPGGCAGHHEVYRVEGPEAARAESLEEMN